MDVEGTRQGAFEARVCLVLRVALVFPGTESAVKRAVPVEEKNGKGQVVVELKLLQVKRIGLDQADPDELIQEGGNLGFYNKTLVSMPMQARQGTHRRTTIRGLQVF